MPLEALYFTSDGISVFVFVIGGSCRYLYGLDIAIALSNLSLGFDLVDTSALLSFASQPEERIVYHDKVK